MRDQHTIELDVRALPTWERHPKILEDFDSLDDGGELRIIVDHEPRPLRYEFERTRAGRYVWLQHMLGGGLWEVTLRRVSAPRAESILEFLKRCPLLTDALPSTQRELESVAIERSFAHNEPVVEQGAEWDSFGLVQHGTLSAVITSPLGREHAVYDVLACEPFGEISTIDGGTTVARFVASSRSARVLLFPKTTVRAALQSDVAFLRAMNDLCAQRMRVVVNRFAAQTSLSTVARVAAALLPHAGPELGLQPVLSTLHTATQGELATAAGTVKEVVSRALAELEGAGAIERSGGRIVKVDRERLTEYVDVL